MCKNKHRMLLNKVPTLSTFPEENMKILWIITSSYFWVRPRRSSSDMSGLKTAIVSYCRRPGGHWGSGLSSRAVETEGEVGSSSEPNPPSKKVPEKSRACDFTTSAQNFCASFFCPSHTFSQILIHLLFFPSHPQILTLRSSDLLSNGRSWRRRVR